MIDRVLAMLGFEDTTVTYHEQKARGTTVSMFTTVANRTSPPASV